MRHFAFWWISAGLLAGCGSSKDAVPPVDTGSTVADDNDNDDEESDPDDDGEGDSDGDADDEDAGEGDDETDADASPPGDEDDTASDDDVTPDTAAPDTGMWGSDASGEVTDCDGLATSPASWIGDGACDVALYCEEHDFDGGDCAEGEVVEDCKGDSVLSSWLGDGYCDEVLDCADTEFDAGDCPSDGADTDSSGSGVDDDADADDDASSDVEPSADGSPTVVLTTIETGDRFFYLDPLTISATISDEEQPADSVYTSVLSDIDGLLWSGYPDTFGEVTLTLPSEGYEALNLGLHNIRVVAVDDDDNLGSDDADITVENYPNPEAAIVSPEDGAWFWSPDPVLFNLAVFDEYTAIEDLVISFTSDLDGDMGPVVPDETGVAEVPFTFTTIGVHVVTLSVTNDAGHSVTQSINVDIRDPLADDGDGDGYTEYDGDCDDADAERSPGLVEECNEKDNDCDGEINDDFKDGFEDNDTKGASHSLGSIDDSWFFGGADDERITLTLHDPGDEDWLYFDAGDDWGVDNVDVNITVGPVPESWSLVVELYLRDSIVATASGGSGTLRLGYEGDTWDGSEDDFWIRVYAETWVPSDCAISFSVTIEDT